MFSITATCMYMYAYFFYIFFKMCDKRTQLKT